MITKADLNWWFETAAAQQWTFAKTMPFCPHEYIVESRSPLEHHDFVRAAHVIHTFGQPGKFYKRTSIYLTSPDGDLKWWTMDLQFDDTNLINRATTERTYGPQNAPSTASGIDTPLDGRATQFDQRHRGPDKLAAIMEIARIAREAGIGPDLTILDIAAGTGLALDMGLAHPERYIAVEPSQAMLNLLVRKNPGVKRVVPGTPQDWLASERSTRPDAVVALGGLGAFVLPTVIHDLRAATDGPILLTHPLADDPARWLPQDSAPDSADGSREVAAQLARASGGVVAEIGGLQVSLDPGNGDR